MIELHEAIRKARKELGMSQQQLADLAGIERKQLSILENGGNVTLATVRKVLAHLPNMPSFTLGDTAQGKIGRPRIAMDEEQTKALAAATQLLGSAMRTLLGALIRGKLPADKDASELHAANRLLYQALGYTPAEAEQEIEKHAVQLPPEQPVTPEQIAALTAAAKEAEATLAAEGFLPPEKPEEDEERDGEHTDAAK